MSSLKKLTILMAIFISTLAWISPSWAVIIEKQIAPLQSRDATILSGSWSELAYEYDKTSIYWDSTEYTSPTVYFEAVLKHGAGSVACSAYAALWGPSGSVTDSQVSTTSSAYTRVRSGPISLTDGQEYRVKVRECSAAYVSTMRSSRLIVVQNSSTISATETYIHLNSYGTSTATTYTTPGWTQPFFYDSSNFDGTVNIYYEVMMYNNTTGKTAYAQLYNATDSGAVTGSELTLSSTNATATRLRTTNPISLTTGKEYVIQLKTQTGGTTYHCTSKIIIQQSGSISQTESHVPIIPAAYGGGSTTYTNNEVYNYFDPANWSDVINTYFHQVYSDSSSGAVRFTQLYNYTDSTEIDHIAWSGTTWTRLRSSPLAMPSTAKTLTAQQKYSSSGGYSCDRLIIQTSFSFKAKLEKQVHLQTVEDRSTTSSTWTRSATGSTILSGVPFYWDSTQYTSSSVYFEAVLKTSATSCFVSAALFKKGAVDYIVAESQVNSNSTSYERVRSGKITLEEGQEYIVEIMRSAGTGYINSSRLIIYQESSSIDNMETQPLLSAYTIGVGNTYTEPAPTYSQPPMRFYYDSSQFDGTVTVYFEAGLRIDGTNTGYARLYNVTNGTAVTDSDVTSTNTDTTVHERKRSGAITLTSGREYTVQFKNSNASGNTWMGGAKLIIQQSGTGLETTESYYQLGFTTYGGTYTNTSYTAKNHINNFEPQNWSGTTPTYYHEATFQMNNSSYNGYMELYNKTDSSSIDIRSSSWSTALTRYRSSSLTMPTASKELEMRVKVDNASYPMYPGGNRLIIQSTFTPTLVKLSSFTAKQYGDHVKLEWRTGYEVDNLGFHLYREENGELYRLTPEPVGGSALLAGSRTALTAGHHYSWWDTSRDSDLSAMSYQPSAIKYWLKDIDLNGKETMHGPVIPVISHEPLPTKFRPELLSEVGMRLQERYRDYWKIQELKERLALKRLEAKGAGTSFPRGAALRASRIEASASSLPSGIKGEYSTGRALLKRSAPLSSRPEADLLVQQYLAGKPAVKLFVKEEGWYRVTQAELVAAGLSPKTNPQFLQLYVEGKEQPIRVIGKKNWDGIEFYGVGLDTPSTDTRVYWLVEGLKSGKRIHEYTGRGGQISPPSFPYTVEKKDRTVYFSALKNGEEENFFGPVIYNGGVNEMLDVSHPDRGTSGDAVLEVVLQGVTNGSHRVKVLFNEMEVGEVTFEGQSQGLFKVELSQSGLLGGENLVSLVGQRGEMDVSLLDFIRLTYWHTYRADEDSLKFTAQGGRELTVDGFSHSRVRVIDITDPDNLFEVFGRVKNRELGYGVTFRVPENGERTLLAFTEEKAKSPIEVFSDRPSFWHQERKGYDLIIISHRDFFDSLQPLKSLRESQGLKVALVDVEDIYDEFSFGAKSPKAIKDFLTLAKANWRKAPRFVLLVGDASFDPRNYLGLGDFDFVPTKLIDTTYMETASDDWFVDLNGDGLSEMAMGRLPVQTAEEASTVVSKIVGYEKSGRMNEILLVADKKEKEFNFEAAILEVKALLPPSMNVKEIFRGNFGSDAEAKEKLLRGINQGPLLVNFIGHGSVEIWRGSLLTSDDAETLTNGLRLPFFVSMTCLNGFFQDVYMETLAEALLKAKSGGAVAVWTSSGLTDPQGQTVMNKELIRLLFNGDSLTIGEAAMRAKAAVGDRDIRRTWILFGDPATRLKY
jgi:hypothetical protein